jgi:hypothetical protein
MFTTIHQKEVLPGETWIEQMNRHKEGILKTSQWGVPENKDARNMAKRLKKHGAHKNNQCQQVKKKNHVASRKLVKGGKRRNRSK